MEDLTNWLEQILEIEKEANEILNDLTESAKYMLNKVDPKNLGNIDSPLTKAYLHRAGLEDKSLWPVEEKLGYTFEEFISETTDSYNNKTEKLRKSGLIGPNDYAYVFNRKDKYRQHSIGDTVGIDSLQDDAVVCITGKNGKLTAGYYEEPKDELEIQHDDSKNYPRTIIVSYNNPENTEISGVNRLLRKEADISKAEYKGKPLYDGQLLTVEQAKKAGIQYESCVNEETIEMCKEKTREHNMIEHSSKGNSIFDISGFNPPLCGFKSGSTPEREDNSFVAQQAAATKNATEFNKTITPAQNQPEKETTKTI